MTGTVLERMTEVPDTLRELDEELATKAAIRLGYHYANNIVHQQNKTRTLQVQLLKFGIPAFTPTSVERYKNRAEWRKWNAMWAWMSLSIPWAVAFFYMMGRTGPTTFWPDSAVLALALLAAAAGLFFVPIFKVQPANWVWRQESIETYTRPIPAHVLQTALIVKEHIVNARLYIDEFILLKTERIADPFLVVKVGGNDAIAFIEVWDEPSFKP